jgi:hypothetical protein
MLRFFLCTFLVIIAHISFGQLAKGHWLVGGSGRFYTYKTESIGNLGTFNGKATQIDVSPNIGYFLADKFAIGMKSTITSIESEESNSTGTIYGGTSNQRYLIGIFGRYYFLDDEKQVNILVDASYQAGIIRAFSNNRGTLRNFIVVAGPVIYFNSTVGIEFLFGYKSEFDKYTSEIFTERKNGFLFNVGLQIHLTR